MFSNVLKLFAGGHHRRFIRECAPIVRKINELDKKYQSLSDDQIKGKTAEFMERYRKGESLDKLLPEAFAVAKNAARRLCGTTYQVCEHEYTWNMVHYDVQLIGGMALHRRKIAEMATGEGKTLVATLPLYLNALSGRNCQLITANDYLARRDAEQMRLLFNWLGLSVGCIQNHMDPHSRRIAYGSNITYGTASEYGFDYLRDNGMATTKEEQVQKEHYFCIIDEADSILIDEARTPLIISGPVAETREAPFMQYKPVVEDVSSRQTRLCNRLASEARIELEKGETGDQAAALDKLIHVHMGAPKNKVLAKIKENGPWRKLFEKYDAEMHADFNKDKRHKLKEELYYTIDEKQHEADLTQIGRDTVAPDNPDAFVLPDLATEFVEIDRDPTLAPERRAELKQDAEKRFVEASERIHCLSQLLRAYALFERDVNYVVQEGKVMIVDENTGRIMPGRRWSDGLHQAVEAKEAVNIEKETKTYATITIQNYFRLYDKLAGMTGTAETEASEFHDIYRLGVVAIPTNKPCIRKDENDIIFKTRREKYAHAVKEIVEANKRGQPVLVGTVSVDASETLSRMLRRAGVAHQVLNAKYHQQEADIVSAAGQPGAVTISTSMAGRGTDIKLGTGVAELGGLYVLSTERNESRRVDRQLRGRCARQGDPGASRFLISLEDDLMRLFSNAGWISRVLEKSFVEGEPLEHPLLNRSITTAQKRVEGQNYSIRKRLLQYDDVLNRQREIVYGIRNAALHTDKPRELVFTLVEEEIENRLDGVFTDPKVKPDAAEFDVFCQWFDLTFPTKIEPEDLAGKDADAARLFALDKVKKLYAERDTYGDEDALANAERGVVLRAIDNNWQDHLTEVEDLRRSVSLRGYAQKDPLNEYKSEAFTAFTEMMKRMRADVCSGLFRPVASFDSFQELLRQLQDMSVETGPADDHHTLADLAAENATPVPELSTRFVEMPADTAIPLFGRNDTVTIRRGDDVVTMKWKKAEPLVRYEGWTVESAVIPDPSPAPASEIAPVAEPAPAPDETPRA